MAVCPNCGEDNPDKAKFCLECATPLTAEPTLQAEERKVVSVLFVDLVGFTARSHDADPEDVRAALAPYHRLLKTEIERFGGTVEKFIGDAVLAVFGPRWHMRTTTNERSGLPCGSQRPGSGCDPGEEYLLAFSGFRAGRRGRHQDGGAPHAWTTRLEIPSTFPQWITYQRMRSSYCFE